MDKLKSKITKLNKENKNKLKVKKNNTKLKFLKQDQQTLNSVNYKHINIDKILKEKLEIINNNLKDLNSSKNNTNRKMNKASYNLLNSKKKKIYHFDKSLNNNKNTLDSSLNINKYKIKDSNSNKRIKFNNDFNIYNKKTIANNEISLDSIEIQNFQKNKLNYSNLSNNKNSLVYTNDSKNSKEKDSVPKTNKHKLLSQLVYKKKKVNKTKKNSFNSLNNDIHNINNQSQSKFKEYKKVNYYMEDLKESLISNQSYYFNYIRSYHLKLNFKLIKKFCHLRSKSHKTDFEISLDHDKNFVLFFDLDETLVHCSLKQINNKCQTFYFNEKKIFLYIRPFLYDLLDDLIKNFTLVLFTASKKNYADSILKLIDPQDKYFKLKLYREHCKTIDKGVFIKNLKIIKNIDLKKTCIIDNSIINFLFQLDNGIPIIPFFGNYIDNEFIKLKNYLNSLLKIKNVTIQNSIKFELSKYLLYNDLNELIKNL